MPNTYADVHLEVDPGTPQTRRDPGKPRADRDTPFRILVLGDFTGRANRGIRTTGPRKAIAVDRDNFDDVLESLQVRLRLPVKDSEPLELAFHELDDFHPDRLYGRLPLFGQLRDVRQRLEDPATFREAARQLGVPLAADTKPAPAPPSAPPPPPKPSGGGLSFLEQALEETETRGSSSPARSTDPLSRYIHALVTPHLTPKADPKQKEVLQMADEAVSTVMRHVLHHSAYQSLEANWRALYFLIRELETSPMLKVYLVDISREEVESDIGEADDLKTTALYKLLVEQTVRTPGAHPWAVVVGAYRFGPVMADLNVLGRMGLLCRQAGAPLLAEADPAMAGCSSLAAKPYPEDWQIVEQREAWELIRSLPESRYIGLALPRFLLRMPYGKSGEGTDLFAFEELTPIPAHEHYLWGNPAFLCAYLLGQNFAENGWRMDGDEFLSVHRLPSHVYKKDGEPHVTPSSEVLLTETAMQKMHDQGLMTLMAYANSDQVRLAGWRSIAAGNQALLSRWG